MCVRVRVRVRVRVCTVWSKHLLVQVVERILFVHAKCNKGIGYVQVQSLF